MHVQRELHLLFFKSKKHGENTIVNNLITKEGDITEHVKVYRYDFSSVWFVSYMMKEKGQTNCHCTHSGIHGDTN